MEKVLQRSLLVFLLFLPASFPSFLPFPLSSFLPFSHSLSPFLPPLLPPPSLPFFFLPSPSTLLLFLPSLYLFLSLSSFSSSNSFSSFPTSSPSLSLYFLSPFFLPLLTNSLLTFPPVFAFASAPRSICVKTSKPRLRKMQLEGPS